MGVPGENHRPFGSCKSNYHAYEHDQRELLKFEEKYCRFFILKNLILVSCKIKYLSEGKLTLCRLRKS